RKQVPADAFDLRQSEPFSKIILKHPPKPLLEYHGLGGFRHLIAADHQTPWQDEALFFFREHSIKLFTRDIAQNHPIPVWEAELAQPWAAGFTELGIFG